MSEGRTPNDASAPVALHRVTTISIQWPLPPPAALEHYERVLPGAAERILRLAELQAGHRRDVETTVVDSNVRRATRGQALAFVLALATILGGLVLIGLGRSVEGLASLLLAVTSLVAVFVVSKRADRAELDRKRTGLQSLPDGPESSPRAGIDRPSARS